MTIIDEHFADATGWLSLTEPCINGEKKAKRVITGQKKSSTLLSMRLLLLAILFPTSLWAQISFEDCNNDIRTYCKEPKEATDIASCLQQNETHLSPLCQQELKRVSGIIKSTGIRGSGGLSSFSGIMGNLGIAPPQKKIISYAGSSAPENNPTTIQQNRLNLASPVWSYGPQDFAMSLNMGQIEFGEAQLWHGEDFKTPCTLSRVELGGQYAKKLDDSRIVGLRASVGSASDKIFYGMKEIIFSVSGSYSYPATGGNYWILTTFISNNNPILNYIPIPGFIYLKKTDTFTGMFGLPFLSLQWTPVKQLLFSTSFFLTNFNAEATYFITENLRLITGFAITQQTFLREERTNVRDRLFFTERKVYLGLKSPLSKSLVGDIQVGQAFDRKLSEGKRFNDTNMSADYGRSWYAGANITAVF